MESNRSINCFATIKNTGKRIRLIKDESSEIQSLSLDAPQPLITFHYGNRIWYDEELVDVVYEDDPRYIADIQSMIEKNEDWRLRAIHYSQRN